MGLPRIMVVLGTRPEFIKLAPVIRELRASSGLTTFVCATGQHAEMLKGLTEFFKIKVDIQLQIMRPNRGLPELTADCLQAISAEIEKRRPTFVLVQGDTTTALGASLAAFFHGVPLVHVEAGLRTHDLFSPWPEEFNRRVVALASTIHCVPTARAEQNLLQEGIARENVHVTGNTIVDSLKWTLSRLDEKSYRRKYGFSPETKRVLVTGHRRENVGEGFDNICEAISMLSRRFPGVEFIFPVHLNPNVRRTVMGKLRGIANVILTDPVPYPEFIWLMSQSHFVMSDSGGLQEECPTLKKPLLILRDTTERPEIVDSGAARLVGSSVKKIVSAATQLLTQDVAYHKMQAKRNPFGDGGAARKIVTILRNDLSSQNVG
jgi:UDP-N-acetylglucosamine 2-epimerase (non-hydrolysing)